MTRSLFVVFEGIDGSGKSTQARLLESFLSSQGIPCECTFEPGESAVGKMIRAMLQGEHTMNARTEAFLFAADRSEHLENVIDPALESGKVVICDRYKYASIAYQTARGMKFKEVDVLNSFAPRPDIVYYIDIDPDIGIARIENGDNEVDEFENIDLLVKVRGVYLKMAKQYNFSVLDGNLPEEELADIIKDEVMGRLS